MAKDRYLQVEAFRTWPLDAGPSTYCLGECRRAPRDLGLDVASVEVPRRLVDDPSAA
jgi:hypothetical protein